MHQPGQRFGRTYGNRRPVFIHSWMGNILLFVSHSMDLKFQPVSIAPLAS